MCLKFWDFLASPHMTDGTVTASSTLPGAGENLQFA